MTCRHCGFMEGSNRTKCQFVCLFFLNKKKKINVLQLQYILSMFYTDMIPLAELLLGVWWCCPIVES